MFWNKFLSLCNMNGKSPSAVCKELGYSTTTATHWKNGAAPRDSALSKISDYFGVPVDYLLGKTDDPVPVGQKKNRTGIGAEELVLEPARIEVYRVIGRVKAGYGGIAVEEYTDEVCQIPADMLRGHTKDDFFVLRVTGDSMYPRLIDGDLVLVERMTSVDSGSIAVVLYDGEDATVKKVRYFPGENWVELVPENKDYEIKRIEGADLAQCKVLGQVRKLIRDV